jgi:hypothetical protein
MAKAAQPKQPFIRNIAMRAPNEPVQFVTPLSVAFRSTPEPASSRLLSAPPDITKPTNDEARNIKKIETQIPTTMHEVRPVNAVHMRDKRPGVFSFFVFLVFAIKIEI